MRSIWSGLLSFGLVDIGVRLVPAAEPRDVAFRQVHRWDAGAVVFRRACTACGREVPYAEVAKGYPGPDGGLVVLDDEDLAALPVAAGRRVVLRSFTSPARIDPALTMHSYHLLPDEDGERAYRVLAGALARSGQLGVASITLRQRESLAVVRPRAGALLLQTLLRPAELTEPGLPPATGDSDPGEPELTLAATLIEAMAVPFDPAAHQDRYREQLEAAVRAKAAGPGDPARTGEPGSPGHSDEFASPTPGMYGPPDDQVRQAGLADLATRLRASLARARPR